MTVTDPVPTSEADVDGSSQAGALPGDAVEVGPGLEVVDRRPLATLAKWVAFVGASAVALWPVLTTPVVADDFVTPFSQIDVAGLNPFTIWEWALTSAPTVGHFNFVGQFVGGTTSLVWMLLISNGIKFSTVLGGTKLLVFVLCALAGARFVREGLRLAEVEISAWWARTVVAVVLFASLQIHMPWSNDPVASFPGSGYASVAVGLGYLSVVAVAVRRRTWRSAVVAAVLGVAAILYYEINVAAVVAAGPLVAWMLFHERGWKRPALVARAAVILGVPAVVTAVIQVMVSPAAANYDGTKIATENSALTTFGKAMASSLPAVAWPRSRNWLNYPVPLRALPTLTLLGLFLVLWFLARRYGTRPVVRVPASASARLAVAALLLSPLLYWSVGTLIQAMTKKVQDEVVDVGQVYNFYAIGASCLVLVVVLAWCVAPRLPWSGVVAPVLVGILVVYASVQFIVNAELSRRMNEATVPNRELLVAYSERPPEPERCQALRNWAAGGFPDYYEQQVIAGIEKGYREFHDEEFCTGFDRIAEGLGA